MQDKRIDNAEQNDEISKIKNHRVAAFYLLYIISLYVLLTFIYTKNTSTELVFYKYIEDFNAWKYIFSIVLCILILTVLLKRYSKIRTFSEQSILLLSLLYFIPGIAMSGILNFEWSYIFQYCLYYSVLIIADKLFHNPNKPLRIFKPASNYYLRAFFIVLSIIVPVFLLNYYGNTFSFDTVVKTLNDPYGMRMSARQNNTRWLIIAIEYWAVYFSCFMITYSLKHKKYAVAVFYSVLELYYFTIQGNRSFVFFLGLAIALGLFKINKYTLSISFLAICVAQIIEYYVIGDNSAIGLFSNIFRRFAIVPNIISTQYFEFFSKNDPDWLAAIFTNIASLFGVDSPYKYGVGFAVGSAFYGGGMNANNGLFGGAYFEFGNLAWLIDPIMFVLSLRLIEKLTIESDEEIKLIIAIIYCTLAINAESIWNNFFRISYILIFFITIAFFCKSEEYLHSGVRIRLKTDLRGRSNR